jgi:hypothetical protein
MVCGEHQRRDVALRRLHRLHHRRRAAPDYLAPPEDRGLGSRRFGGNTKRQAAAASAATFERKHEPRAVRRAATQGDPVGDTTLMSLEIGQSDFRKANAGIPHPRSVSVDSQVLSRLEVPENRAPGVFDFLVREAPVLGAAQPASVLVPVGKHLGCCAHCGFLRWSHPVAKARKMHERVRGHRRLLGGPA